MIPPDGVPADLEAALPCFGKASTEQAEAKAYAQQRDVARQEAEKLRGDVERVFNDLLSHRGDAHAWYLEIVQRLRAALDAGEPSDAEDSR